MNAENVPFDDDDEDECRVCRGPAEEGHPLFRPCVCSGSIGSTHQDCLQSWLEVQRTGDGSCELCRTRFRFAPRYAPNAPEKLTRWQVVTGLASRAVARWFPLALRILFTASLWLIVAPLVTAYWYHAWMARPSVILHRVFSWKLLVTDLVSGDVIAACIIVTFLSLMSFADFLRVEWQHGDRVEGPPEVEPNAAGDIDDGVWNHVQQQVLRQQGGPRRNVLLDQLAARDRAAEGLALLNRRGIMEGPDYENSSSDDEYLDIEEEEDDDDEEELEDDDEDWDEDIDSDDDEEEDDFHPIWLPEDPIQRPRQRAQRPIPPQRREARREPLENEQPPEEPVDMDINIALDELLGVRGPLGVVVRNLLWLLAFNAIYLGFFAFVPRTIGIAMYSIFSNTTVAPAVAPVVALSLSAPYNGTDNADYAVLLSSAPKSTDEPNAFNATEDWSFAKVWKAIDDESVRQSTAFRLHDVAMVTLGYLSLALAVVFFRCMWFLSQKVRFFRSAHERIGNPPDANEIREAMEGMNRIVQNLGNEGPNGGELPQGVPIAVALGMALEAMTAVVKVGVLLFVKMFLLPIALGVALDFSMTPLLGTNLDDMISYAGRDIFSFMLLHWVAGITFMLLVTVGVLQMREVVHPDLLAQMIRPQEPQPDLLGNLMHESVSTHSKRMVLSLIIYAVLLAVHVYVPVRFVVSKVISDHVKSYLRLRFAYVVTPQLQVPLELLMFHLCMLALLEKHKNGLGEMQHRWLKFMTGIMGISDRILPKRVRGFVLKGVRPLFLSRGRVDHFWYDLTRNDKAECEALINENLDTFESEDMWYAVPRYVMGETHVNGSRGLSSATDFIRLPQRLPGRALRSRSVLLPARFGKYRLKRNDMDIELWEEEQGAPIPRPPEGWDDLGAGGADVQGRWAWGTEKKSVVERCVAARRQLFGRGQSWKESAVVGLKLLVLAVLSWLVVTVLLCCMFAVPLAVGRFIFYVLRVPDRWVHDPLAYGCGFVTMFPLVMKAARFLTEGDASLVRRFLTWIWFFQFPTTRQGLVLLSTAVLLFGAAPLLLGHIYEIAFVNAGEAPLFDTDTSIFLTWMSGAVLLHRWSDWCTLGILTRDYRMFVLEGREAGELVDAGGPPVWQGRNGRMAIFWTAWKHVALSWDWEFANEALLYGCAFPVFAELSILLCISLVAFLFLVWKIPAMSVFVRASIVRSVLGTTCIVQLSRMWKDELGSWFEAAHRAARDDRYLIGEVLLNYGE